METPINGHAIRMDSPTQNTFLKGTRPKPLRKHLGQFIGDNEKMLQVYQEIQKVAVRDTTVLVTGNTGVGKELVAQAIHNHSNRAGHVLVDVNCAAIPKELAESEFFGHEKGAFSGAIGAKKGKFELAQRGTLFLDEIGELPLELQAKFLRVLQEKKIWKIGSQKPTPLNVRIIAATHKNLEEEVKKGNFRADLFFRLSVFPIHLPPLRERGEDVILLAHHFLKTLAPHIPGFTPRTTERLTNYHWPGNVRELAHCIERAVIHHDSHLPLEMPVEGSFLCSQTHQVVKPITTPIQVKTLDEYIRDAITKSLVRNNFNKSRTAKELGILRKRLDRLIQKYSLLSI